MLRAPSNRRDQLCTKRFGALDRFEPAGGIVIELLGQVGEPLRATTSASSRNHFVGEGTSVAAFFCSQGGAGKSGESKSAQAAAVDHGLLMQQRLGREFQLAAVCFQQVFLGVPWVGDMQIVEHDPPIEKRNA